MPVNPALRSLATDGRFSLQDAQQLKQLVQQGKVSQEEAKEALTRYGEVMDPEAGRVLEQFTGATRASTMGSLPAGVQGQTLRRGDNGPDVSTLQRGLMALGQKQQNPAFTLPSGVDGAYGNETASAVRAFQSANGITATGVADPNTMRALDAALRGERFTPSPTQPTGAQPTVPTRPARGLGGTGGTGSTAPVATTPAGPTRATPEATVAAAEAIVAGPNARNYGVSERWINNDPRHAAPTNKPINGTADRWKCNLFAGNVMVAAGFEPPYYGNRRTGGEYPNANQLYKWSDKYAARNGNANNVRFTLGDEVRDMPNMSPEARRARLDEMFSKLKPGDLLIADHVGTEVADGGHCRVYLGKDENGNHRFAQAAQGQAETQVEGPDDVMNEEHLWILRPNTPRR